MNYNKIVNHLYIGNIVPKSNFFHLIVNCTHEIPFSYFCTERVRIPVEDDAIDALKFLQLLINTKVLEKMQKCILQKENVLVHCFGDEDQRSFVVIICFLIRYCRYTPKEAIDYVHMKKNITYLDHIHFITTINIFYYYTINNFNKRL